MKELEDRGAVLKDLDGAELMTIRWNESAFAEHTVPVWGEGSGMARWFAALLTLVKAEERQRAASRRTVAEATAEAIVHMGELAGRKELGPPS